MKIPEKYFRQCLMKRCLLNPVPSGGRKKLNSPNSSCCAFELPQLILRRHWLLNKFKQKGVLAWGCNSTQLCTNALACAAGCARLVTLPAVGQACPSACRQVLGYAHPK